MQDLVHSITVKRAISPDEGAGDDTAKVSQIIDVQGYDACTFVIATGALADANATFTVLVEDGDDSGLTDNAAVADGYLISQSSSAPETAASFQFDDDNEVRTIGYIGPKRYVRLTITPASNTGAWDIGAVCILSHRRALPFTQPSA